MRGPERGPEGGPEGGPEEGVQVLSTSTLIHQIFGQWNTKFHFHLVEAIYNKVQLNDLGTDNNSEQSYVGLYRTTSL